MTSMHPSLTSFQLIRNKYFNRIRETSMQLKLLTMKYGGTILLPSIVENLK